MRAYRKLDLRGLQHGQAIVLIALAFVGLAAFIGLTVDAGILFTNIGHLRRATDAASLAAANQFREGRTPPELSALANELLIINGLSPSGVVAKICDLSGLPGPPKYPDYHDATLCPAGEEPFTKEVRVEATLPINFAFLPIIGWNSLTISANSVSQAASVDLVLVIDNSGSMAFDLCTNADDDDDEEDDGNDCPGFPPFFDKLGTYSEADAGLCNAAGTCQPFENIRSAALGFLNNMFFPYDRMAVVSFSHLASGNPGDPISGMKISLADGDNFTDVQKAINELMVSGPAPPPCDLVNTGDPRGCPTTNTAAGLIRAGNLFGDNDGDGTGGDFRPDSVWIVILLSDGAANAALAELGNPGVLDDWICPPPGGPTGAPTWVPGFCRDPVFEIGTGAYGFDAEDAAVDAGLFVGCPDENSNQPVLCKAVEPGGQGAIIFTIGYGDLVINSPACQSYYDVLSIPCEPNQGEELLRYIADIAEDRTGPDLPRACESKPTSTITNPVNCGNYYFAASEKQLEKVFEAIASRIFTRITH